MKYLLFIWAFGFIAAVQAQTDSAALIAEDDVMVFVKPPINEETKFGIKIGFGIGTMLGTELANPRPSSILTGGAYYRNRFSKHWSLQPELNISFRGSRFANQPSEYGQIKTYYLDLPILLMRGLNEKNTTNIVGGFQYSRQLNASLYLINSPLPESNAPKLTKQDAAIIIGMQWQTPFVGFQLLAKYGLLNLNNGLLSNLNPPNGGGTIHQAGIELNMLF